MRFRGEYFFLSNFYPCKIELQMPDGRLHLFLNAESAFQAHKSSDSSVIAKFEQMTGAQAKKAGRKIKVADIAKWDSERISVMQKVIREKFKQNPELMRKLRDIKGVIYEDNTWNDVFWGVCNGKGENHLGEILMDIRNHAEQ